MQTIKGSTSYFTIPINKIRKWFETPNFPLISCDSILTAIKMELHPKLEPPSYFVYPCVQVAPMKAIGMALHEGR